MALPKIRLLYYKNVVEECLRAFFDEQCSSFAKDGFGRYVLADPSSLERHFRGAMPVVLRKYAKPFDILRPEYTFVIGGCAPAENMLLRYRDGRFPKKLSAALAAGCPRYALKEKDIMLDMRMLDDMSDRLFVTAFTDGFGKTLGQGYSNVFAIRHRALDCYSVFKAMKYLYGRSNCVNVWKDDMRSPAQCITAVNDLIDLYVNNKTAMNGSREFKAAVEEIRQYADMCMKGVRDGRER